MARHTGRVAVVWRGDGDPRQTRNHARLAPVFDALADVGVLAEPVVCCDRTIDAAHDALLRVDGALVWVDPIGDGEDRTRLDAMLRDVSQRGIWVSAHPDSIQKMGTKAVLHRTKSLGWGTDTHLYATAAEFRDRFPKRLSAGQPRVLKQNRGNGGIGVWKVTLLGDAAPGTTPGEDALVRVQHAAPRDDVTEDLTLGAFMDRCAVYFARSGRLVDQAFAERLAEGMIRAYLVQDEVVGFARQQPAARSDDDTAPPPEAVLGMPSAKTMYDAPHPEFAALANSLEQDWVPGLRTLTGIGDDDLPLLWDADFLYGPRTEGGADTYILCEVNVSSVLPFPERAPAQLAQAVAKRVGR